MNTGGIKPLAESKKDGVTAEPLGGGAVGVLPVSSQSHLAHGQLGDLSSVAELSGVLILSRQQQSARKVPAGQQQWRSPGASWTVDKDSPVEVGVTVASCPPT